MTTQRLALSLKPITYYMVIITQHFHLLHFVPLFQPQCPPLPRLHCHHLHHRPIYWLDLMREQLYAGLMRRGSTGTSVRGLESHEGACKYLKGPITLAIDTVFNIFKNKLGVFSIIVNLFRKIFR